MFGSGAATPHHSSLSFESERGRGREKERTRGTGIGPVIQENYSRIETTQVKNRDGKSHNVESGICLIKCLARREDGEDRAPDEYIRLEVQASDQGIWLSLSLDLHRYTALTLTSHTIHSLSLHLYLDPPK